MKNYKSKFLIEKDLSYKLVGIFIEISQKHGYLLKEKAYYQLLMNSFINKKLKYIQHPRIKLFNPNNSNHLDNYYPDFIIEDIIILEVKAQNQIYHNHINQLIKYLSISRYELGYIVNFGTPKAQIERKVFTNDRKPFLYNTPMTH